MPQQDRLAELLGSLSLATDRARGQAPESALATTVITTRLGQRMGVEGDELRDAYYAALTRTLGCTSMAMDIAPLALGDDLSFSYAMHMSDLADAGSVRKGLESHFAQGADAEQRAGAIDAVLELQPQFPYMAVPIGQQAVALSRRLPVSENVADLLTYLDARWDGQNPTKPAGEEIPLIVRIIELATVAELYRRAGGLEAALELAEARSGGQFDPEVCAAFKRFAPDLVEGFAATSLWDVFLKAEPAPSVVIEAGDRRLFAEITADFADNKSGWFVGNSRRGAALAAAGAEWLGMSDEDREVVMLAGLMRDVGRCAVSNGVWDKPGPLSDRETTIARSHSQHTEEILASSAPLHPLARLGGSVHERGDGSGYHRGSRTLDDRAAVLAAADVYTALTSDRPWRDAYSSAAASELLEREAGEGRLSSRAVDAVLAACGRQRTAPRSEYPDGLTKREVEVLELVARGLLTKQIASKLGIAYKTVDNHVQSVYRKIGANTRAAAAVYALERGIFSD